MTNEEAINELCRGIKTGKCKKDALIRAVIALETLDSIGAVIDEVDSRYVIGSLDRYFYRVRDIYCQIDDNIETRGNCLGFW